MRKLLFLTLLLSTTAFAAPGNDANCLLLMHNDTGFSDSSKYGHPATLANTPTISQNHKLGSNAGAFVALSSQKVTFPTATEYALGTGDFTVDLWFNLTTTASSYTIISIDGTTSGIDITLLDDTTVRVFLVGVGVNFTVASMGTGIWHHLELERDGSNERVFMDGIQGGTTQTNSGSILNTAGIYVGCRSDSSNFFNGLIDEVRFSNIARHIQNFTPATTNYCQSCEMMGTN